MLQYIINSTAIWLTGLIVFDLFFRREPHHGYNRFYLLTFVIAGALVPLWQWDYDSVIYATGFSQPIIEQTVLAREAIVNNTTANLALGWEEWLQIIYICGVTVCLMLLMNDFVIILRLYNKGDKSKHSTWTIIETGRNMSPFSAFRMVFISAKEDYTKEELAMVLAHEEQHGHLLHFIDVLIIRLFHILFWFNPMIYLLEKRLLLVHEYQADLAVENNPSEYGRFLVEQSVLNAAPVLAHSFIRSPLKKRILMLTRKTTTLARGKQLLIAPVLLLSLLCFTQNAFSGEEPQKDGNKITYKGNVFETLAFLPDTTEVIDPKTGEMHMIITKLDKPAKIVKMNNENVITVEEKLNNLSVRNAYSKIKSEIGEVVNKLTSKLPEANYKYDIHNVIIDKKGEIVYYELEGISEVAIRSGNGKQSNMQPAIEGRVKKEIDNAIVKTLKNIRMKPISMDGQLQICSLRIQEFFSVE